MSKSQSRPTLTEVLRTTMRRSRLSLYRIGKDAGIDQANLGRFLRGELSMTLANADRLATYLGLHLVPDPNAQMPEPTPENLARPMLARRSRKRKAT